MLDVKSLILATEEEKKDEEVEKARARKKAEVEYKIELESGCDFAVSRKTKKNETLLVILMSQNQFYLKDMKSGEITQLTAGGLQKFVSDTTDGIKLENVNWIDCLERGKAAADWTMSYMNDYYCPAAKKGMLYVPSQITCNSARIESLLRIYKESPALSEWLVDYLADFYGMSRKDILKIMVNGRPNDGQYKIVNLFDSFDALVTMSNAFGIEWARKYVETFLVSDTTNVADNFMLEYLFYGEGATRARYSYYRGDTPLDKSHVKRIFKAENFIEYITYEACRQGEATSLQHFMSEWYDVLRMQEECYGKIRDKYPEHLATMHNQLSYLSWQMREQIDEQHWYEAVETMEQYEWKPEGYKYQIICPKKTVDMRDEASQQQNCLASYIGRVTNKECMIFFLRRSKKELEDQSLVTIELFYNKRVGQVKAKNNREPDDECKRFVARWAEEKGLDYIY